jgi:hypothetical protein
MKRAISILALMFFCVVGFGQVNSDSLASQENQSIQKIKVFPNPATNVVNILGLINSAKADILVSDVYGNALLKHQWHIKNNAINIPIASLDSGIYMVTIVSQEQKVQTKFYKK